MSNLLQNILGLTCIIPAIAGLYAYRINKDKSFTPFVIAMWVDVFTEVLMRILLLNLSKPQLGAALNLYVCVNCCLYMSFFYRQTIIKQRRTFYLAIMGAVVIIGSHYLYVVNMKQLVTNTDYYFVVPAILFSIIYFVLAIALLNNQFFRFRIPFNKNPKAILAIGIIVFYIDYILIFSMMLLHLTDAYSDKIFSIHQIVNAITYLIFAWGLLCIPNTNKYLQ